MLEDPDTVAGWLYATPADEIATRATLATLMACLEVPIRSAESEMEAHRASLDANEPSVLDAQLDSAAAALSIGGYVELDPLVQELAGKGVITPDGEPVSREAFDAGVARAAASNDDSHVVPALMLALGRAQAEVEPADMPDPTWAVPRFDALQLLLLELGLQTLTADQASTTTSASVYLAAFITPGGTSPLLPAQQGGLGASASWLGGFVRPGRVDVGAVLSCTTLWMARVGLTITASPNAIWHRNGRDPDTADVEALVSGDPTIEERFLADQFGCPYPSSTADLRALSVHWTLGPGAGRHGALDITMPGLTTRYVAVQEKTPQDLQIPPNEHGTVVQVHGELIVPGSRLALRYLHGRGPRNDVDIAVSWYEAPDYKVDFEYNGVRVSGIKCDEHVGTWTLQVKGTVPPGVEIDGTVTLHLARSWDVPAPSPYVPETEHPGLFDLTYRAKLQGRPVGAEVVSHGQAKFILGADGPPRTDPQIEVSVLSAEAQGWAISPIRRHERNESGDEVDTFVLPVEEGDFC